MRRFQFPFPRSESNLNERENSAKYFFYQNNEENRSYIGRNKFEISRLIRKFIIQKAGCTKSQVGYIDLLYSGHTQSDAFSLNDRLFQ